MQTGLIQDLAPEFDSSALGATGNLKIDTAGGTRRIYGLLIKAMGTKHQAGDGHPYLTPEFEALVEHLSVLVDGKVKMLLNPRLARRFDLYLNANADYLAEDTLLVPFTRPGYPGSSWGTGDITSLHIKAKIVNTMPTQDPSGYAFDYTYTGLKACLAYLNLDKPEPRGSVFLQSTINLNPIAGWNQIDDLPIDNIAFASRLIFDHPAVTEVEIKVRDEVVFHLPKWAARR